MRRLLLALIFVAGAISRTEAIDQGGALEAWVDTYGTGDPEFQEWFRATYALDVQPRRWLFVKLALIFELDSNGEFRRDRVYDDPDRGLT